MAVNSTNVFGFNISGNNTSPDQFGHLIRKVYNGYIQGLEATQNSTPNMTVSVAEGIAVLTKNTTSSVWGEVKTATNVTIQTADTANPRIDTVIIYEDTSVTLPTAKPYLTDGGGGRFKLASISGTAAASPVALTDSAIQSQIGAGKPWARIADITVPANSTTILNSNINNSVSNQLSAAIAEKAITADKIDGSSIVICYQEATSTFNSGGAGSFSGSGIGAAMNVSFTVTKEAAYEVSLVLPNVYSAASATTYFVRALAGATTLLQSGTGSIARGSEPITLTMRRRMNLTPGTYNVQFTWYGTVAGAGNAITVGCSTHNPATFMVKLL